jgi:hypothetical protein
VVESETPLSACIYVVFFVYLPQDCSVFVIPNLFFKDLCLSEGKERDLYPILLLLLLFFFFYEKR